MVWYWDSPSSDINPRLGKWLGVAHSIGSAMCYWIIGNNAKVLARSTVQHVTIDERNNPETKDMIDKFNENLVGRLSEKDISRIKNESIDLSLLIDNEEEADELEEPSAIEADEHTSEAFDQYLGAELKTIYQGESVQATVTKRMKDSNGNPVGRRHKNPLLDTRKYEVELSDGMTLEYTANQIAESIYSQVDSEG